MGLIQMVGSMALGAGLVYMLDPARGNRRRAIARDQMIRVLKNASDATGVIARDLTNRTRGMMAETLSMFRNQNVPDAVLEERVRSKLGGVVSHPGSIEVMANQGRIILRGPVLANEVNRLLNRVATIRGVKGIDNRLEVHQHPDNVPGLQGAPSPRRQRFGRFELMQTYWSPTARFLVGAAGGALAFYGVTRRGILGSAVGTVGMGMLARSVTNMPMRRIIGMGAGRRAVDLRKTINVNAPIEEVYRFWSNFENFPRFMANVREVRDLGNGRSHWSVAGPAGMPVEWNAVITRMEPNRVLAWKSEPGEMVQHAGIIHFDSNPDGSTRIDIQMTYNPPAGAMGHTLASLFGSNPKQQMDEDLVRFKSLIEQGMTTAHGATVTHEEVSRESPPEHTSEEARQL